MIFGDVKPSGRLLWREQAVVVVGGIGQERAPEKSTPQTSPAEADALMILIHGRFRTNAAQTDAATDL
ncbi:hypothetical protein ACVW1A_007093 [Bradyrhizobium sp. LB1.3]